MAEPADMFGDHNIILADHSEDARAIAAVVSNIRDPHEVAANAALVGAAPDLLANLEWAEKFISGLVGGCAQVESIRAAIAKAKGENQ